jgi:hypothetical protein
MSVQRFVSATEQLGLKLVRNFEGDWLLDILDSSGYSDGPYSRYAVAGTGFRLMLRAAAAFHRGELQRLPICG